MEAVTANASKAKMPYNKSFARECFATLRIPTTQTLDLKQMDKEEAKIVLNTLLAKYRAKTYNDLQYLLNEQDISGVEAESGAMYQLEIQAVWDDKKDGNLRVMGSVDGGGLRAFMPLTSDFIISPNGEFIGE